MKIQTLWQKMREGCSRFRWRHLPFLLMIMILSLPLPFVVSKSLRASTVHKDGRLVGVLAVNSTRHTMPSWQNQFSTWLDQQIPFREDLIRLHNQIYFYLFQRSYMSDSSLIIGKKQYLYDMSYIISYCNLNHQVYRQESFDQWAKQLAAINQFFLRRGQKFIYVITPSKAAYDPEYLPERIPCKDIRPSYIMAKAALKRVHIPYVDGSEITLNYRSQYGDLLFPRGGMHWTLLAATFTANELAKKISAMTGQQLPKITYSYTTGFVPQGWEQDLVSLANLSSANKNYIVPIVSYTPDRDFQGKRLKLAVIGGSFAAGMLDAFDQAQLFARIDYYFYFKLEHHYFTGDSFVKYGEKGASLPFDPDNPQAYQNILDADVVILEENENLANASAHLGFFAYWLMQQPGWFSGRISQAHH